MISRIIRKPVMLGLPVSLTIEPTTSCNLRCPECPSGLRSFTRPTGKINFELFKGIIDEMHQTLVYLNLYFQGEPYLHPEFDQLTRYAVSRNIYTATSTNGHFLDEENCRRTIESGLDRLIISIDGTDQETYQKYRIGGCLDKVVTGTRILLKFRGKSGSNKPFIVYQFLAFKHNEHQIFGIKSLGKELGVDAVWIKTAQVYNYEIGSTLIPENTRLSRYFRGENGRYSIKNRLYNHCWKMWHSCVISWDGKVGPCCFDKDLKYTFGNVSRDKLANIWGNQAYDEFRSKILTSRKQIEICRNCSEGTKIWI